MFCSLSWSTPKKNSFSYFSYEKDATLDDRLLRDGSDALTAW